MSTLKATSKLHRIFCSRLTSERNKRGLSKSDAARLIGITPQIYGDLESGRYTPRFDTIERIASAFDIEPTEFFSVDA